MLRINALTLTFVFISTFMKAQDSLDDETRALITRAACLVLTTRSAPPPCNSQGHHVGNGTRIEKSETIHRG